MDRATKKEIAAEVFWTSVNLVETTRTLGAFYGDTPGKLFNDKMRLDGRLWGLIDAVDLIDPRYAEHLRNLYRFIRRRLHIQRKVSILGRVIDNDNY